MSSQATNELRSRLIRRGITWQMIADSLGITRQTVWATVVGRTKNPVVRRAIAEASGMSVKRLWPVEKVTG